MCTTSVDVRLNNSSFTLMPRPYHSIEKGQKGTREGKRRMKEDEWDRLEEEVKEVQLEESAIRRSRRRTAAMMNGEVEPTTTTPEPVTSVRQSRRSRPDDLLGSVASTEMGKGKRVRVNRLERLQAEGEAVERGQRRRRRGGPDVEEAQEAEEWLGER
jgi:hypothetical protein